MAVPGTIQALIAAFSFGILFNAASAALVLHVKDHGSAIYRDGLRLALVLFLSASSTWALVEFLATLIEPNANTICQVAVSFSSLFDQVGRLAVEQYLVWGVPKGDAKTVFSLVPQILVFGRLFVGIAFTAVTRTQFRPTCAPVSSVRAVSVTAIALDGVIIGLLLVQAFSGGLAGKNTASSSMILKVKTARLLVVGVAVWWGTSVTSLLGLESIDLFYKTALPGIGLTILVGLVTILSQTLTVPRELPQRPDSPLSRGVRDLSSSDSTAYPPSRYEDLKGANVMSISAFAAKREVGRGIRRNEDGTFPAISKPIAAGLDTNGNPIQAQTPAQPSDLAPALSAVPPIPANWGIIQTTNGHIRAGSKSKVKTGKLAISHPILNEDENIQSSLKRIPTIGLAEAAGNDKLRREMYGRRISNLVAQRPAPRPPSPRIAPDTVAAELQRSESTKSNKTSGGLSVEGNASSTGTLLSPGIDAIRRRSPRQPESTALTTPFRVIKPGEPIRIPIPRPLERDPESPPTKPEPVKTPLQRRATTGLPSNPRAQTLKLLAKENKSQKTQTVMFVNNIVYNNPDAIGDIIQGAAKAPHPPDSGDSVVNRPRPIPRKGDKDRQVFPAEISPGNQHRRTKSGGSIMSRKSILQLVPGTPTGLPSLPPIPSIGSVTNRPVPNNTNSMTVEEKMNLLYLAPLSAPPSTGFGARRRSSVPTIPPIPIGLQEGRLQPPVHNSPGSESNYDARESRASKITTARTSSLLEITPGSQSIGQDNTPAIPPSNDNTMNELGGPWPPRIPLDTRDENIANSGDVKRRSSTVLPMGRQSDMSTIQSEGRYGDEETITNWGSVHSPVAPVSRQNARSTYILRGPRNAASAEEIPILIFDQSSGDQEEDSDPRSDSESDTSSQNLPGQFHRRIGDDCPTFSTRKDKPRPRKMPPPTPLLLDGRTVRRTIAVQPRDPSPIESPTVAYEAIQTQLRKFEQLDEDSVESPRRRLALLANLEQEMGQLESKWQSNHNHLDRDSMSSMQTTPSRDSRPTSLVLAPPSQRVSVASAIAERRASRRARMQNAIKEERLAPSITTEAHTQYTEKVPELPVKRNNLNSSATPKGGSESLGTHKTDELHLDGESDRSHSTSSLEIQHPVAPVHGLWSRRTSTRETSRSWLWDSQISVSSEQNSSYELPGLSIRPSTRKNLGQLIIESSNLWQGNSKRTPTTPQEGLWNNPASQHPGSLKAPARPVTIRPPRKNKRITLLPDIIESPKPLPYKRDTLGIFQFPWGEKSEHATLHYSPGPVHAAMPGTMTTGRLPLNSIIDTRIAQQEETGYSASFFDEYDEEEGDNFSDYSGSGDDEFDETMLWEIASLLKTDQVPSRESLLLTPSQISPFISNPHLPEYGMDLPSDDEREECDTAGIVTSRGASAAAERPMALHDDVIQSLLWTPRRTPPARVCEFGLPQHEGLSLAELIADPIKKSRSRALTSSLEPIQSTGLWSPTIKQTEGARKDSFLWMIPEGVGERREMPTESVRVQNQAPGLWMRSGESTGSSTTRHSSPLGLLEPESQVWQELISRNRGTSRSKSRLDNSPVTINSSTLWSQNEVARPKILWSRPPPPPVLESNILFTHRVSRVNYRTTTHYSAVPSLPRRISRRDGTPLESLMSNSLWTLQGSTPIISSSAGLWEPSVKHPTTKSTPLPTVAVAGASSRGLWKQPVQRQMSVSSGLFDPKITRHDFRRTLQPPIVVSSSTAPRVVRGGLAVLSSHRLWAYEHVQATVKDEEPARLWQGVSRTNINAPTLFKLGAERTDYRTTSADPAALVMVRKPRTIQQPLQPIESTRLWADNQVASSMRIDWITASSLPPPLPASSSILPPSPNVNMTKTSATTTPVATTPGKSKKGLFSNWFSKKTNKDSTSVIAPEAQLDAVSLTADMSELPEDIAVTNLDDIPRTKPVYTALRHRHRATIVYNADWDAALIEAVAASYPKDMLTLRASYPRDWDDQLREAVFAGYGVTEATRSRAIPGDWAAALHQAVVESYPKPGTRHRDSPTSAPASSSLWTKPLEPQAAPADDSMWAARRSEEESESDSGIDPTIARHMRRDDVSGHYYPKRSNKGAHPSGSQTGVDFGKRGLWRRGDASGRPRHPSTLRKNWLEDTVNKRFTRIELRY